MDIVKIAAVGLVAGLLAIIIKKNNPELSVQISIAAGIMIFLMVADQLVYAVDFLRNFSEQYEGVYEGVKVVLKITGIAYVCEFAVQILRDAGENATASKIELGGKVMIMVVTLPLLGNFLDIILSLM